MQNNQQRIPEIDIPNQPLWRNQVGPFRASIWENQRTANGKNFTVRELSFSKRYRTEKGEYKDTTKYQANDIPKAILSLQKAYEQLITPDGNEDSE
ncbi:MAG: hypothetical protein IPI28_03380 [Candidatus Omnitrophica bacterium]|nr:hypothetical protein [Candidatus Omnitrophota bacterium]